MMPFVHDGSRIQIQNVTMNVSYHVTAEFFVVVSVMFAHHNACCLPCLTSSPHDSDSDWLLDDGGKMKP